MALIHHLGDSWARGFALGVFADQAAPTDPLYAFRSIWAMGDALAEENGLPLHFVWKSLSSYSDAGQAAAVGYYAGAYTEPGDWVVLEDAGSHNENPDAYQASLAGILAALAGRGLHVAVMTIPDYAPAPIDCQFDTVFGARTMNDAVRAAASAAGVTVLDINAKMDTWRNNAMTIDGVAVMRSDGIHPNVWGQMRVLGALFGLTGLTPMAYQSLMQPARANWQALGYGTTSSSWTVDRAEAYCSTVTQP